METKSKVWMAEEQRRDVEILRAGRRTNRGAVTFSAGCGRFRSNLFDWKFIAANSSSRRVKFLLFA